MPRAPLRQHLRQIHRMPRRPVKSLPAHMIRPQPPRLLQHPPRLRPPQPNRLNHTRIRQHLHPLQSLPVPTLLRPHHLLRHPPHPITQSRPVPQQRPAFPPMHQINNRHLHPLRHRLSHRHRLQLLPQNRRRRRKGKQLVRMRPPRLPHPPPPLRVRPQSRDRLRQRSLIARLHQQPRLLMHHHLRNPRHRRRNHRQPARHRFRDHRRQNIRRPHRIHNARQHKKIRLRQLPLDLLLAPHPQQMHPILQPLPLNLRLQLLPQWPIPHDPRLHRHLLLPQQRARPDQMLKPLELNQPPHRNHPQRIPHLHPRPRKIIQLNPIVNAHNLPLTVRTHLTKQVPAVITHRHHKLRLPRHLRQQVLASQIKHEILRMRRETERKPQLLQKQRTMRRPVRKMHMHMQHPQLTQPHRHEPRIPRPRPRLIPRPIALLMIL